VDPSGRRGIPALRFRHHNVSKQYPGQLSSDKYEQISVRVKKSRLTAWIKLAPDAQPPCCSPGRPSTGSHMVGIDYTDERFIDSPHLDAHRARELPIGPLLRLLAGGEQVTQVFTDSPVRKPIAGSYGRLPRWDIAREVVEQDSPASADAGQDEGLRGYVDGARRGPEAWAAGVWLGDQAGGVAAVDEPLVSLSYVVGHRLGDRVPALGVELDALGVADQHVDDAVGIADGGDVVIERGRDGLADHLDVGPDLAAGGVGASLLVGAGDQHDRAWRDAAVGQQLPAADQVLGGVGGGRFDEDGLVGYAERPCVVAVVHRFAAGEDRFGGRASAWWMGLQHTVEASVARPGRGLGRYRWWLPASHLCPSQHHSRVGGSSPGRHRRLPSSSRSLRA
jgi:hypothetical protein